MYLTNSWATDPGELTRAIGDYQAAQGPRQPSGNPQADAEDEAMDMIKRFKQGTPQQGASQDARAAQWYRDNTTDKPGPLAMPPGTLGNMMSGMAMRGGGAGQGQPGGSLDSTVSTLMGRAARPTQTWQDVLPQGVAAKDMTGSEFLRGMNGGMLQDPENISLNGMRRWLQYGTGGFNGESPADRARQMQAFMGANQVAQGHEKNQNELLGHLVNSQTLRDIEDQKMQATFGEKGLYQKFYSDSVKAGKTPAEADASARQAVKDARGARAVFSGRNGESAPVAEPTVGNGAEGGTPKTPSLLTRPDAKYDNGALDAIFAKATPGGHLNVQGLLGALTAKAQAGLVTPETLTNLRDRLRAATGGSDQLLAPIEAEIAKRQVSLGGDPTSGSGIQITPNWNKSYTPSRIRPTSPQMTGYTFKYPSGREIFHDPGVWNKLEPTLNTTAERYRQEMPALLEMLSGFGR